MWFSQFSCSSSTPPVRYAVAPIQVVAHDCHYCVASAWGWRLEKISHLVRRLVLHRCWFQPCLRMFIQALVSCKTDWLYYHLSPVCRKQSSEVKDHQTKSFPLSSRKWTIWYSTHNIPSPPLPPNILPTPQARCFNGHMKCYENPIDWVTALI